MDIVLVPLKREGAEQVIMISQTAPTPTSSYIIAPFKIAIYRHEAPCTCKSTSISMSQERSLQFQRLERQAEEGSANNTQASKSPST